jgi:hypothetical protein
MKQLDPTVGEYHLIVFVEHPAAITQKMSVFP